MLNQESEIGELIDGTADIVIPIDVIIQILRADSCPDLNFCRRNIGGQFIILLDLQRSARFQRPNI